METNDKASNKELHRIGKKCLPSLRQHRHAVTNLPDGTGFFVYVSMMELFNLVQHEHKR